MAGSEYQTHSRHQAGSRSSDARAPAPGRTTLSEIQCRAAQPASGDVRAAAAHGISGPASELPHGRTIAQLFGRHDISQIKAHVDRLALEATTQIGASAYAAGDHIAFAGTPSLHTAAHEAAHVVQQRAGVHLLGGVGAPGDPYEQHADRVADLVVQGKSAEAELDRHAGRGAAGAAAVQMTTGMSKPVPGADDHIAAGYAPDAEDYASDIAVAYGKNENLQDVCNQISQLTPKGPLSSQDIVTLKQLAVTALKTDQLRIAVRAGTGAVKPAGLVPNRLGTYMQAAMSLLDKPKVKKQDEKAKSDESENDDVVDIGDKLVHLSSTILLPELTKRGAFPKLEYGSVEDGSCAWFSRTNWTITLVVHILDLEMTQSRLKEMASTVAHETRHVEQTWLEICTATRAVTERFRDSAITEKTGKITQNTDVVRKLLGSINEVDNEQLRKIVEGGKRHGAFKYQKTSDNVRKHIIDMDDPSTVETQPTVKQVQTYLESEQHYYANPRERDAYAVESLMK